jgi:VanZ family protein
LRELDLAVPFDRHQSTSQVRIQNWKIYHQQPSQPRNALLDAAAVTTIGAIVKSSIIPAQRAAGPAAAAPAGPRTSSLARTGLLVYLALLVYGSLSPWTGWRSLGVGPLAFLDAPWPSHVTGFDLALNVLAYLPLGALLVLAWYPRLRGAAAVTAAIVVASGLSVTLESLQSYLPARIASNLDVVTNIAGTAFGAVAAAVLAPRLIDGKRLQLARQRWFRPHSAALVVLAALWPLAQVHPGPMLFGNGELNREAVSSVLAWFGLQPLAFDAGRFASAEVLVTACGMLAAGAAMTAGMKPRAPRLRLLLLLLGAALAAKAITYGHEFGPERAFAWLTPGAVAGLAAGVLAVTAVATTESVRAASALAGAALLILVVAVNVVPSNPYHAHWLASWQPGRLRNVAASSGWLAQAWPFAVLAVLLWTRRRPRHMLHPVPNR